MIEEEDQIVDQGGDMLLYDYFKHLTSLSLLSLGGVLALAEKARGSDSYAMLLGVVVTVGLAGVCSFGGASEIVRSRYRKAPASKQINFYRIAAPALLSIGLGGFIYMFAKTMVTA